MDQPSSTSSSRSKQASLSELLQEEQEPFVLEAYLFQKGYYYSREEKSLINSENSTSYGCFSENNCCSSSNAKLLKRLDNKSRRVKGRSRSISAATEKCLNIARTVLEKVVLINMIGRETKCDNKDEKLDSTSKEAWRRDERLGPGSDISWDSDDDSYSTKFQVQSHGFEVAEKESPIYAGHLNRLQPDEAILLWRILAQNRECVPVSVFDQIESSPVYSDGKNSLMTQQHISTASNLRFPMEGTEEEFVLSPSLWELLVWSPTASPDGGVAERRNACYFQYINSNKTVENNTSKEKKRLRVPGEVTCDNNMIRSWGKRRGERKKLTQMIRLELVGSLREYCTLLEGFVREIGKEVVERILEEIKDELVAEMVGVFAGNG